MDPTIVNETTQEFKGKLYRTCRSRRYLERTGGSLHRAVWIENYGEIPKDYCIHHMNGNPLDNRLENLALLPQSVHQYIHWSSRKVRLYVCQHCGKSFFSRHQDKTRPRWCGENCKATAKDRRNGIMGWKLYDSCVVCGKMFDQPQRMRYCGPSHRMAAYRARKSSRKSESPAEQSST